MSTLPAGLQSHLLREGFLPQRVRPSSVLISRPPQSLVYVCMCVCVYVCMCVCTSLCLCSLYSIHTTHPITSTSFAISWPHSLADVEIPINILSKTDRHWCVELKFIKYYYGLPRWLSSKESTCQRRKRQRHGFNSWVGKIPWRRKWQPAQYSCLENPMDRGAWQATVHQGLKESDMTKYAHRYYYVLNL